MMHIPLFRGKTSLFAGVLTLLLAVPAMACTLPSGSGALKAQVIQLLNAERARAGLPALRSSGQLGQASQSLACDNAARQALQHVGLDGSRVGQRARAAGYRFRSVTEVIYRGRGDARAAVNWWMNSPDHRTNILSQTRDIGVGVALSSAPDSRLHWVVNMGVTK